MHNYDLLIQKLDRFIRKYYLNKLIRGSLYTLGLVLLLFLVFVFLEYQFYFGMAVRKGLFFSFLGVSIAAFAGWVGLPMAKYFRLGSLISHEQAARIIGNHFGHVKDKLLNILQLRNQAVHSADASLIEASISQKTDEIKVVNFPKAIDLRNNRKYLRYALPPLLILLAFLVMAPQIIRDGSSRIIRNNVYFEKPAPFHFKIDNESLETVQFDDFPLEVSTEGEIVPDEVMIQVGDFSYRLKKLDKNTFGYTFKNVRDDIRFTLSSGEINSREYVLETLLKPQIAGIEILLDYPAYTGLKDKRIRNTGDLLIPTGTKASWTLEANNTEEVALRFSEGDKSVKLERIGQNSFGHQQQILNSGWYKLLISNDLVKNADSVQYTINAIPDRYPSIGVEAFRDSMEKDVVYFQGSADDDYGIRKISFHYSLKNESGDIKEEGSELLATPASRQAAYDYLLEADSFELEPGDELSYYFEVFDNDGVNGSKSARTSIMQLKKPGLEEYEQLEEENSDEIKGKLKESIEENKRLREEIKSLREKILSKKDMSWEDKKELEKLLEKQKELEKKLEKAREKFEENLENEQEFKKNMDEETLEKQKKLQEMFEESVDEETRELMEKIQEMLQELNRDKALEMMENFDFNQQDMNMDMERLLELYKELEVEKEMQELSEKLNELAEEQEKLSEESKQEQRSNEELGEQQEEISEEFEKVMEDKEDLEKKNQELERPKDLGDTEQQENEARDQMEKSQEQLEQQENKKASESQKNAAQKMREMANQMQSAMSGSQMEQMQADMKTLRQLLENLVNLSFDQEDLIADFARTSTYTPRFVGLVQEQFKIKEDFKMVKDSLHSLSKRVMQIESFITEKVQDVHSNIEKSIAELEERQKTQASDNQRRAMTGLNDLALMLSETMNQMQQQMSSMMPGQQMCSKPNGQGGQGQKPMDKITKGQGELNKEIDRWKKAMEQSGQNKPGSKEFAEMAAQQAELRKMLRDMQNKMKEQGQGSELLEQIMEEMNKVETELVNKTLSNETVKRQQDILTRLLQAEQAERQRDWDNKREAETARDADRKLPPAIEKYIKERNAEIEYFRTVSPEIRPYYRRLVEQYYKSIQ